MTEMIIKKSKNPKKKYDAVIDNKKTVSFGASGYEERKERYIARHKVNQDWKGYKTAFLLYAENIVWNKPTMEASVKDTNQSFQI